jgi:hypothetical protein
MSINVPVVYMEPVNFDAGNPSQGQLEGVIPEN